MGTSFKGMTRDQIIEELEKPDERKNAIRDIVYNSSHLHGGEVPWRPPEDDWDIKEINRKDPKPEDYEFLPRQGNPPDSRMLAIFNYIHDAEDLQDTCDYSEYDNWQRGIMDYLASIANSQVALAKTLCLIAEALKR